MVRLTGSAAIGALSVLLAVGQAEAQMLQLAIGSALSLTLSD
jgi:hypothetical protein